MMFVLISGRNLSMSFRDKLRLDHTHKWYVEGNEVWVLILAGSLPSSDPEPITGASLYGMLRRGESSTYFYKNDRYPTEFMLSKDGWIGYYTITDEELQWFFYFCGDLSRVKNIDWKKAGF